MDYMGFSNKMDKTAPKVSIIIPAYNAEKYIERCLNSVVAQTMPDFECIIVDDGSTDRTGEIADDYARNDSRFKVIHQPNGGVSVARQTGIDAAIGVYTIQFDADDWVETNMLEVLFTEAERQNADMVFCDFYRVENVEGPEILLSQKPVSLHPEILIGQMMHDLGATLWNKLIKRDCFSLYNIRFIPKTLCEDQYICFCLLLHPIKVAYIPVALYHYDLSQNPNSLVNSGISPIERLRPLEFIASSTDITNIQEYYDRAILRIAYEAFFPQLGKCNNYPQLFKKHLPSIRRVKGVPIRIKVLIILRIYGIHIPIDSIKKVFGRYK